MLTCALHGHQGSREILRSKIFKKVQNFTFHPPQFSGHPFKSGAQVPSRKIKVNINLRQLCMVFIIGKATYPSISQSYQNRDTNVDLEHRIHLKWYLFLRINILFFKMLISLKVKNQIHVKNQQIITSMTFIRTIPFVLLTCSRTSKHIWSAGAIYKIQI